MGGVAEGGMGSRGVRGGVCTGSHARRSSVCCRCFLARAPRARQVWCAAFEVGTVMDGASPVLLDCLFLSFLVIVAGGTLCVCPTGKIRLHSEAPITQ